MFKKFTNWYFSRQALPYWGILFIDCMVVVFATMVGMYLDFENAFIAHNLRVIGLTLPVVVLAFMVCFRLFHTYQGILRYSSFIDLQRVATANLTATVVLGLLTIPFSHWDFLALPSFRGAVLLFLMATLGMWVVRVTVKRLFDGYRLDEAEPVAIYGTQAGGLSLAKSISSMPKKKFRLVAFITDNPALRSAYLMGKKVYPNNEHIAQDMSLLGVKVLLVSPLKNELFRNNPEMIDTFLSKGIKVRMMPASQEWDGKTKLSHQMLHEVDIEDLLPREKIEVDMDAIGALLTGKRILITGAAGSIGSEMVRQVALYKPAEMVLIDQAETPMHDIRLMMMRQFGDIAAETIVSSITNKEHMEKIFAAHKPDYVFHAAAYKHVPMMEDNPGVAVQNNIYGTRVIADLAVKYGTKKFVMISTDKAVNPTNVMGCSKRICEIYCQSLNKAIVEGRVKGVTQFVTTRFGNVLGSNGSVIPIFKEQIKKGGPITVTHPDIIRFFMLIPEACKLVLEAGTMGKGGEIFVFDMGAPVRIVDLAKRMITLSGAKDVEIRFSGLREGEKLYEEVLNDAEQTKPTHHPKIMIASVREYDYETACRNEERLLEASHSFKDMDIVKIMKEIVPEYRSQHSKYQVLDKPLN